MRNKSLTVVAPVYDEVQGIERLLTELLGVLSSLSYDFDVILVDDGSTDE